jgi:IPT/TIG domain
MANARGGDRRDVPALYMWVEVLAVTLLLASLVFAQGAPRVTTVEPSSGKVNDNITLTGDHLGKDSVSAVFLSDEKDDFKAVVVEQTDNKIIIKVPQVKPGNYNVSLQVGDKIFIEPVRFKVQQ